MNRPHNYVHIDMAGFAEWYSQDRQAVRKIAQKHGVTIPIIYSRMEHAGIKRRAPGDSSKETQAREKNPNWKDGTTKRKDGYILERVGGKQLFQHRVVAAEMLGRRLAEGEVVHHKNGDKADNRPENLEVFASNVEHMKHHTAALKAKADG